MRSNLRKEKKNSIPLWRILSGLAGSCDLDCVPFLNSEIEVRVPLLFGEWV